MALTVPGEEGHLPAVDGTDDEIVARVAVGRAHRDALGVLEELIEAGSADDADLGARLVRSRGSGSFGCTHGSRLSAGSGPRGCDQLLVDDAPDEDVDVDELLEDEDPLDDEELLVSLELVLSLELLLESLELDELLEPGVEELDEERESVR